tara:strand:- start:958 stop:1563 length:606 start_codon:yes stop_codon:yes gene_type:complete
MKSPKYCKFAFISLNKTLVESYAWNSLTNKQIRVFIYLWSCLQWFKQKKKKAIPSNNGDIAVSTVKMREKLNISKQTCSKAIHKLIEVGLIRLTRIGYNKVCHKYKILYDIVPQIEERWKKYPDQNWKHECPKTPNTLVGKDTRFKSHPNKVDHKFNKQSSKVDLKSSNSQVELTHNDVFDDDKQSTSLGSIIYNHSDVNK